MPRYLRVKIVTPEREAAERRAGMLMFLTLAALAVQAIGTIHLALSLRSEHHPQAAVGAACAVLGAWAGLYVDARSRRRSFRTGRFLLSASLSIAFGLTIGLR
ncbi:hypothetical protein ACIRD2_14540 [Streptomyces sp. NPDC093595]|uniref:hypothetical protein n=1 Tax=Streptomyces sp. NPDC093595 TaxID=3366045 RepID=UPI0037F3A18F